MSRNWTGIFSALSPSFRTTVTLFMLAYGVNQPASMIASMMVIPSRYGIDFGAVTSPRTVILWSWA
ncbi:MAG TPA: hypothetical protein DC005_04975 [Proteobacteria bacterium]|nr:MAG: hypothetical protein COS73_09700 [Nitrospirae bacterium CG06_land_8_20_14_3_00_70_43]PIX84458.1 MAG: hypothetical protein COZ33_00190 [Nitrospirae bacterium CG_4_10_14_3_um_filter_70_108]HBB40782.1 hypothetical protein [Pseudomonadota bacterium]